MKTSHVARYLLILSLALVALATPVWSANTAPTVPAPTPYRIVEIGANHRIWQRETYAAYPNGQVVTNITKYTELASGLYFQKNGQWTESKEEIESYPGGAVAQTGSYQVIWANNLNSEGAIDLKTQEGKRFRSNILGLAYYDSATGNSVLIGQIQDSQGELISSNQVLYPNAFSGIKADVRYTYLRGQFEQDVILREQPPTPESLGFDSQTTEIEVLTEFINPPEARVVEHRETEHSLPDHEISWGRSWIGQGRAFALGEEAESSGPVAQVRVRRQYATIKGRHILVEAVPLSKIASHLENLPLHTSRQAKLPKTASKLPNIPKTPMARLQDQSMKLASFTPPNQGYVLDYLQINSSQTNMVFQGDTTYFISGGNNFSGTVTFEGGTVLKFATNAAGITLNSNIICQTSPYRPAILTSMNDNTVGDGISGSSGSPSYGSDYLQFQETGTNSPISNFRFCYATRAFLDYDPCLTNCQFLNCFWAVAVNDLTANGRASLHNVLVTGNQSTIVVARSDFKNTTTEGEQLTVNNGIFLGTIYTTNSLFCDMASVPANSFGSHNGFYNCPEFGDNAITNTSYPFQSVGAGSYYLATGSPFHNVGTTNINPAVLADIAVRTTYPPVVYSNTFISSATSLGPQASRDNVGTPDLGYHYDPLDYVVGGVDLTSSLTFATGTAVGWYEGYGNSDNTSQPGNGYFGGQPYGIAIDDGGHLAFSGTATQPCHVALYNLVQEGNGNWTTYGWMAGFVLNGSGNLPLPQLSANFTKWSSTMAYSPLRDNSDSGNGQFVNCELYVNGLASYGSTFSFTNCLLWRSWLGVNSGESATYQNCTFYNGALNLARSAGQSSSSWSILNCAFDGTALSGQDGLNGNPNNTHFDCNAYNSANHSWTNCVLVWGIPGVGTLETIGAHDQTNLTTLGWQSSWFGNFYLPPNSALINAGSITADQVGLYHFTTQTNQVPEGDSTVDIGYHYVATDAYGNPLDSNGDGIPDYLEDANGDGIVDDGETNWSLAPAILTQPVSQMAMVSGTVAFDAVAVGTPTPTYQWYFNGTNVLAGATNSALTIQNVQTNEAGNYSVVVTNNFGGVTSSLAGLTVVNWTTTTPTNISGGTAVYAISVSAAGSCSGPFTYQWQHDGTNIGNIITTVAGVYNTLGIDSGDGGPATNAYLAFASGVAVDVTGNLYIADTENNVIRKVNTNGIITTVAGINESSFLYSGDGGMATNASLAYPNGVVVDATGNLFIADTGNNVIRKVDTNGIITTVAGSNALGSNYSGDGGAATNATLSSPSQVALDGTGNLYIADIGNSVIRKVATNGIITTVAGSSTLAGNYSGDGGAATNAGLKYPNGVVVDGPGNLYIADAGNGVIRKVATNGIITTIAGKFPLAGSDSGDGGMATNAGLAFPLAVAVDATGNLYIADSENNVIREVTINGIITTVAGNYNLGYGYSGDGNLATSARLAFPFDVTLGPTGNLYIADYENSVIREAIASTILNISGGTLTLSNLTTAAAGTYQVIVSGPCGSLTSSATTLTVLVLPPSITNQPASQLVLQGSNATFTVSAAGTAPFTYQWYFNNNQLAGATNSTMVIANVQPTNAGNYAVTLANPAGSATSSTATLAVLVPPTITTEPVSQTVVSGATASFAVSAIGTGPLTYQWLTNGAPLNSVTGTNLVVTNAQDGNATFYQVVVSSPYGSAASSVVTLTVLDPPTIFSQPVSEVADAGQTAVLSVVAGGASPLGYQWYFNSIPLANQTNASLIFNPIQTNNAGNFFVVASNQVGSVTSSVAALTVLVPPAITVPPLNGLAALGSNATLFVTATGTQPLSYQWYFNGVPLVNGSNGVTVACDIIMTVVSNNLKNPTGVAVDGSGNLYIADTANNSVHKVATNGVITTLTGLVQPKGVAVDSFGNVFIADTVNNVVRKWATNGVLTTVVGNTVLASPYGVAVDGFGNLYITDTGHYVVRKLATNGVLTTVAGNGVAGYIGDGGVATAAEFSSPAGITVDAIGNLYITDGSQAANGNAYGAVRKVSTNGIITTVAGGFNRNGSSGNDGLGDGNPATNAYLNTPTGVAVDSLGNLYIADVGDNVIRMVATNGIINTVAGIPSNEGGVAGYSGDGGPATSANLSTAQGLAVGGPFGNLYIADTGNSVIREVTGPTVSVGSNGTLTIFDAQACMAGNYQVIVSNAAGVVASPIVSLAVDPSAAIPVITPSGGTFRTQQTVTLNCSTPGALMYYTLNGNVPTQADPVATNGQTLVVYGTATLNVDAFAAGSAPSGVNSAAFTITGAIAAGDKFTLGLRYNGGVLAAGTNYTGQLGDGTLSNRLAWVTVSNLTSGVTAISAGTNFSLALTTNGTVRAWGYNASGQLGDGTTTTRTTNVLVTNLTSVAAIAAGGSHSLALLSNGVVRAWGYNGSGQLGDGTTTTRTTNVLVTNLTSVVAIAAGGMHSLALSNGYVRAWGYNGSGQLGDGTTTTRTTNVLATNLTSVAAIAAGGSHSLALLSNGVVRAWGLNNGGQLGDGTTINRSTNVLVTNLTSVVAIAAGTSHSLALLSNGTVMAWGTNNFGQLGDGTTNQYRLTPVLVTNLSNVVAIAAGSEHSVALESNGTVVIWGCTNYGMGGFSSTPVIGQPGTPLTYFAAPIIVTQPSSLTANVGQSVALEVSVTGTMPMSYQWYSNSLPLLNTTNATLTFNNPQTNVSASYYVTVANAVGSVTSATAILTVLFPPVVYSQPAGLILSAGSTATFNVGVVGSSPLSYQWYGVNSGLLAGATSASLVLNNVQSANDDNYYVVVGNSIGVVTSAYVPLTVVAPIITSQPSPTSVTVGNNASFSVTAGGTATYQWYFNLEPIAGATNSSLLLTNVALSAAGNYFVIVANTVGTVASAAASLTVNPAVAVPAPANLIDWWQAENNAVDVVGGLNGTLSGSGVTYVPGEVGQAFHFSGTNSSVSFGNAAGGFGTNNFTIEFWMRSAATVAITNGTGPFILPTNYNGWPANIFVDYFSQYVAGLWVTNVSFTGLYLYDSIRSTNGALVYTLNLGSHNAYLTYNDPGWRNSTIGSSPAQPVWILGNNYPDAGQQAPYSTINNNPFGQWFDSLAYNQPVTLQVVDGLPSLFTPNPYGTYVANLVTNTTDIFSEYPVLVKSTACNSSNGFTIRLEGQGANNPLPGTLVADLGQAAGNYVRLQSARVVNDGFFHHVALVRQTTNLTLYLDGSFETSGSSTGLVSIGTSVALTAGTSPCVGSDGGLTTNYAGDLDELSFYNRSLQASEIQSIYNAAGAGKLSSAPYLITQPTNQLLFVGNTANFSLSAGGTAPLSYQWYGFQAGLLPGATTANLTLSNLQTNNSDSYFVVVANSFGTAASAAAALTVLNSTNLTAWELANLGTTNVNLNADADGSGWTVLQEYLYGLTPNGVAQPLNIIITQPSGKTVLP